MVSYLILHNLRSAENVGAIFRSADAVGVAKIFLTGYTPAPVDQFGRISSKVAKAALGAEKSVAWEKVNSLSRLLTKLKKVETEIVALEQVSNSVDYKKYKPTGNWALILGNETDGIDKTILKKCDRIIEIPMRGQKESLNVSAATAVALYSILDR